MGNYDWGVSVSLWIGTGELFIKVINGTDTIVQDWKFYIFTFLKTQKTLFRNALISTTKVVYFFGNNFLLNIKGGLPCVIHFYTPFSPPIPSYRIVYSFSMSWLWITSFLADLICVLSKIKYKFLPETIIYRCSLK